MTAKAGRQEQRSAATRRAIVRAARRRFARDGYAATPVEEILRRAKVSRGALYHHYDSKQAIFRAVFEQLQEELAETVAAAVAAERRPERRLAAAVDGFLDACLEREVQQVVLRDAPSVLPWDEWHAIQVRHALGVLTDALEDAVAAGRLDRQPIEPLANVLLGSLNAAALSMARASDPRAARRQVGRTVHRVVEGLHAS